MNDKLKGIKILKRKRKQTREKGRRAKSPASTIFIVNTTPMHEQSPPYLEFAETCSG